MLTDIYSFPEGKIIALALVFLRMVAFIVAWPVFGTANVPSNVKVLLAVLFTMIIFPTISLNNPGLLASSMQLPLLVAREIAIGLTLGFIMRMFFYAISIGGEITSISMGLSSAQQYNPALGSTSNVVEQYQLVIATVFFLAINGHHIMISGLAKSFEILPVAGIGINYSGFGGITETFQQAFVMGVKLSAPIMVSIFLTNVAMGILGRAVPQINVLVTSFPITIILGFVVLFITVPYLMEEMTGILDIMSFNFFNLMKVL